MRCVFLPYGGSQTGGRGFPADSWQEQGSHAGDLPEGKDRYEDIWAASAPDRATDVSRTKAGSQKSPDRDGQYPKDQVKDLLGQTDLPRNIILTVDIFSVVHDPAVSLIPFSFFADERIEFF